MEQISSYVWSIFSAVRVEKRYYSTKMLKPLATCLVTCLCNRHKTCQNCDVKIIQSESCSDFWSDLMGLKLDRLAVTVWRNEAKYVTMREQIVTAPSFLLKARLKVIPGMQHTWHTFFGENRPSVWFKIESCAIKKTALFTTSIPNKVNRHQEVLQWNKPVINCRACNAVLLSS